MSLRLPYALVRLTLGPRSAWPASAVVRPISITATAPVCRRHKAFNR